MKHQREFGRWSVKPIAVDAAGNPVHICIFCHSQQDLSKEHVLAKKWRKHLGVPGSGQINGGWYRQSFAGPVIRVGKTIPKQDPFTWTVKTVCRPCNNGWMSSLEDDAEPALLPMALGESPVLSAQQVRIIETWMAKTALVIESMDEGAKAMTPDFASRVKETDPRYGSPAGFLQAINAVEPTQDTQMRSSVHGVTLGDHECTGHFWRITTVQLGAVAFLTIHTADPVASEIVWDAEPFDMHGQTAWNCVDGWSLDRTSPLSPLAVMEHHTQVAEYLASRADPARP